MPRLLISLLTVCLLCGPLILQAAQLDRQGLFRIERSKNANIIQYDAQVRPNGKLDKKNPVVGYWIRLAEQGQIKELSWLQSKFAFGFDADLDADHEGVSLDMTADLGRPIDVQRYGQEYKAIVDIDGKLSQLEKIYIHATGKGLSTTVNYMDLHGMDLASGEATYQRIVP
jgi:hypothetical protein